MKRNRDRFPADFVFQITSREFEDLRFQIGTSNARRGGRRYLPFAFTEHGIAMLSSVLRGQRAARVNVAIMRAFVKLKEMAISGEEFARKLHVIERNLIKHERRHRKHSREIRSIFGAIHALLNPETRKIAGFKHG